MDEYYGWRPKTIMTRGLALLDEFSDAISACVRPPFDGDMRLVAITKHDDESGSQI
jgi:hypothetical protein